MSIAKVVLRVPACLQSRGVNIYTNHCGQSTWAKSQQTGKRDLHYGDAVRSSHLSDPENRGESQKGVNFDTLGSWNSRLEMSIDIKKSIQKGSLIPEIPLGKNDFRIHLFIINISDINYMYIH